MLGKQNDMACRVTPEAKTEGLKILGKNNCQPNFYAQQNYKLGVKVEQRYV